MTQNTSACATPKSVNETNNKSMKIGGIMEAASALSALQEESSPRAAETTSPVKEGGENPDVSEQQADADPTGSSDEKEDSSSANKTRFLPSNKRPDAAPTFPEKMMKLMTYVDKQNDKGEYCASWCEDGKSFIIRDTDTFTRDVVARFFKPTKFTSFTRKLYRWGFRQINRGLGPDDPVVFGNEYFQRDKPELIASMRSVTAASTRKAEQQRMATMVGGYKRGFEETGMIADEDSQKRMFFNQYLQQKQMQMAHQQVYYGGVCNPNGSMPLSNALRPGIGMQNTAGGPGLGPMGTSSAMMHQNMPNQSTMSSMQQLIGGGQYGNPGSPSQYPNQQTTSDIVNAAIAALRHAA